MVHGGKTVYAKGFGVKDVRSGEKIDPDTVFQLASLSKPLSATVVAHQVGQNAIGWDTPIVSKLPWFALSDPAVTPMVSVGDMFSHRSGCPTTQATCSRTSATTGGTCWNDSGSCRSTRSESRMPTPTSG